MSIRKDIRYAVTGIIKSAATPAGLNVFPSRTQPVFEHLLPMILIYTKEEESELLSPSMPTLTRTLNLVIDVYAKAYQKSSVTPAETVNVDDFLDDFADEIEDAIDDHASINGLSQKTELKKTEIALDDDGKLIMGNLRLTFAITYLSGVP